MEWKGDPRWTSTSDTSTTSTWCLWRKPSAKTKSKCLKKSSTIVLSSSNKCVSTTKHKPWVELNSMEDSKQTSTPLSPNSVTTFKVMEPRKKMFYQAKKSSSLMTSLYPNILPSSPPILKCFLSEALWISLKIYSWFLRIWKTSKIKNKPSKRP